MPTSGRSIPALLLAALTALSTSCGGGSAPPRNEPPPPAAAQRELRDEHAQHAGASLHWLEAGPADGRVVLLLHGGRFRADTWQELGTLEVLAAAGYRALAPDLPGFGESEPGSLEREDFLASWLDALGVERCVLVCASMSGSFALPFLAAAPERVTGLVALAPVGIEEWAPEIESPRMPALLLWGGADRTVPVAEAELLAARLPRSRTVVFEGAGHPAYLEQPERFHAELLDLLGE